MDADELFCKGGVDILLFGHARAPAGQRLTYQQVLVRVGLFERHLLVYGDRVWQRQRASRLVASDPVPFERIPLTYANAFGGKASWDGLEVPYADNPDGKGFYLSEEEADGGPLPNVESHENRVSQWDDRPDPMGVAPYPMQWGLRVRNGVTIDASGGTFDIRPTFFNSAHPRMIAPAVKAGDPVLVAGVTPDGQIRFSVPNLQVRLSVRFGNRTWEKRPHIESIGLEPERERFFVSYRYPFRYRIVPLQIRRLHISASGI